MTERLCLEKATFRHGDYVFVLAMTDVECHRSFGHKGECRSETTNDWTSPSGQTFRDVRVVRWMSDGNRVLAALGER